jgi:hypothetical protein
VIGQRKAAVIRLWTWRACSRASLGKRRYGSTANVALARFETDSVV